MTDPQPYDEDGEPVIYDNEHELGHTPRMADEPRELEPDHYLDASYEDRYDIGDSHDL
jgi:hypothetical protein